MVSFLLCEIVKAKKYVFVRRGRRVNTEQIHIPALSEFDMTIRGLLGHIVCVQGYCGAMQKRV